EKPITLRAKTAAKNRNSRLCVRFIPLLCASRRRNHRHHFDRGALTNMKKFSSLNVKMAVLLWLAITAPAQAATLTVTNLNDNGAGSLRQAISIAASGDAINFSVVGTIPLTNGELLIATDLGIVGPGPANLAISGRGLTRIFEVATNVVASISCLTITGGSAGDGNAGAFLPLRTRPTRRNQSLLPPATAAPAVALSM